jgi:DNA-binding response OmpR family regulator
MKTSKAHRRQTNSVRPVSILLAEDDTELRKLLCWSLERNGYHVVECSDGMSLMKKLGLLGPADRVQPHDLIISDVRMPGVTGMQVLENVREFTNFPPMILITAFPDAASRNQATKLGAVAMIAKPFDIEELLDKIEETIPVETPERERQGDWLVAGEEPPFPLEITFRHGSGLEAAGDYIRSVAAKLHPLSRHVSNGRIVIDQADAGQRKKHRYMLTLVLSTPGKPIVVKYDTDKGATHDDLYMAINLVFATALRKLRDFIEKRQEH